MNVAVDDAIEVTVLNVICGCHACGTQQMVPADMVTGWFESHYDPIARIAQVLMPDNEVVWLHVDNVQQI